MNYLFYFIILFYLHFIFCDQIQSSLEVDLKEEKPMFDDYFLSSNPLIIYVNKNNMIMKCKIINVDRFYEYISNNKVKRTYFIKHIYINNELIYNLTLIRTFRTIPNIIEESIFNNLCVEYRIRLESSFTSMIYVVVFIAIAIFIFHLTNS